MHHTLEQRVAETIECHGLVASYTDKIYIAISGGADSVALLMAMLALGYRERLEALHCNFSLRIGSLSASRYSPPYRAL